MTAESSRWRKWLSPATGVLSGLLYALAFPPLEWVILLPLAPVPWLRLLGPLFLAAGVMALVTWLLAPFSLLLAPVAGAAVYAALLLALRAFGAEERDVLAQVLRRRPAA